MQRCLVHAMYLSASAVGGSVYKCSTITFVVTSPASGSEVLQSVCLQVSHALIIRADQSRASIS